MSNPHALIIDDNANNLEILANLLATEGVSHTAIQDPVKVPTELNTLEKIDLVFCDLEMPKVDGYQILSILREHFGKAVPIITYTVHISEIEKARQMGFDGFLGKPLDADRFPSYIKLILNGQPVWEIP